MKGLDLTNNPYETMSSLDLVAIINSGRKDSNVVLRHSDFLRKVPDVLGGGERNFTSSYFSEQNKELPCYRFKKREACLMMMSYSYELQAKVFDRMTEMENKLRSLEDKNKVFALKEDKRVREIFKMHLNDFSNFYPQKEAVIKASEKTKLETGFDLMTACGITVDTDTVNLEHDAIMRIFWDERKRTERQVIQSRSGVKPFSELKKGKSKVIRKTLNELCNDGLLSKCGDTFSIPA